MPIFSYKVRNKAGETERGWIDAINKNAVADVLGDRNLIIINIKKQRYIGFFENIWNTLLKRVRTRYVVLFMHEMSELISSEIPIVKALRILEEQTKNKYLRKVIREIADDVEGGDKLSNACGKHRRIFTDFFVKMIKAGETSGKLEDVFMYLAEQQEKNYLLSKKMRNVMIYPFFMLFTLFGVAVIMLVSVIPKIQYMFEGTEKELPFSTKILIGMTNFFFSYWWFVLLFIVIIFYVLKIYRGHYWGERIVSGVILKIPVLGELIKKFYLARFSKSFNTLILGGVDIITSLKASKEVVGNLLYGELLDETIREVEKGKTISSVFSRSDLVPPMYSQMIYVGEKTGKLSSVLDRVNNFYTGEIEDAVKNSMSFLEPALIVLIGIVASFLASAIILPMYNLSMGG